MKRKLKVLITSNIPSPYFVDYCEELNKYVDLTVVFERKNASDRDKSWSFEKCHTFNTIFLNGFKIGNENAFSLKINKIIKLSFDRIIIANPATPTGITAILYCKKHKIPYILQSEGGFQGKGTGLKENFKRYLFKDASMYLSGMGTDDDYFLMYGATKEKIEKYNFCSMHKNEILSKPISLEEKNELKKKLGIPTKHMILYVGQFTVLTNY